PPRGRGAKSGSEPRMKDDPSRVATGANASPSAPPAESNSSLPGPSDASSVALSAGGALVLYDGVCPLCSRAVRFILPRDPKGVFRFASLESPLGRELLRSRDLPADADTMVLLESDRTSLRSDAVLRILARMRFPWRLF